MDVASIDAKLQAGEQLKIKYRYPLKGKESSRSPRYGVRTDKLLDVSVEIDRFYTCFRSETPIWLEADEVIEVTPDDGVYEDLPAA
jgi:hypothetical protein